uniref:Uncharacterized protein n=1 Tax=Ficedula albicollis TaxID=59894 RepID=A0A803VW18_FICAL
MKYTNNCTLFNHYQQLHCLLKSLDPQPGSSSLWVKNTTRGEAARRREPYPCYVTCAPGSGCARGPARSAVLGDRHRCPARPPGDGVTASHRASPLQYLLT